MPDLFKDIIPSIMDRKDIVIHDEQDEKDYNPFMINRALSLHGDCLFAALEMNRLYHLPKAMQYQYYLAAIRKRKRPFVPWPKKQKDDDLKLVMRHFNYSPAKAMDAIKILTEDQLDQIRQMYESIDK
jgi:hypothetical protein